MYKERLTFCVKAEDCVDYIPDNSICCYIRGFMYCDSDVGKLVQTIKEIHEEAHRKNIGDVVNVITLKTKCLNCEIVEKKKLCLRFRLSSLELTRFKAFCADCGKVTIFEVVRKTEEKAKIAKPTMIYVPTLAQVLDYELFLEDSFF
jgi:hypothetical protein